MEKLSTFWKAHRDKIRLVATIAACVLFWYLFFFVDAVATLATIAFLCGFKYLFLEEPIHTIEITFKDKNAD
ncbi:hypothetical protein CJ260_00520 [Megasphaera sp. ASD88]|nr:hypothetical protein CJ260_00520 [Megasphaera sp. ASD88]